MPSWLALLLVYLLSLDLCGCLSLVTHARTPPASPAQCTYTAGAYRGYRTYRGCISQSDQPLSHLYSPTALSMKPTSPSPDLQHNNKSNKQLIGTTAKYFVSLSASLAILCSDSPLPLYYVSCGILNSISSKLLKNLIRQPRPAASPKQGYGMPSSHAQSILYFATVLAFKSPLGAPVEELGTWGALLGSAGLVAVPAYCYYACSWRIQAGLHSTEQTLVGAAIGILTASLVVALELQVLSLLLPASLPPLPLPPLPLSPHTLSLPLPQRLLFTVLGNLLLYAKEVKGMLGNQGTEGTKGEEGTKGKEGTNGTKGE